MQKFVIFEFFSLIFAQILMKFCRNFADVLENVEINFSEIFEFFSLIFAQILMKFYRNFADVLENIEIFEFKKVLRFF